LTIGTGTGRGSPRALSVGCPYQWRYALQMNRIRVPNPQLIAVAPRNMHSGGQQLYVALTGVQHFGRAVSLSDGREVRVPSRLAPDIRGLLPPLSIAVKIKFVHAAQVSHTNRFGEELYV